MSAIFGGTGETGKEIIKNILNSNRLKSLLLLNRREVIENYKNYDTTVNLSEKIVDFEKINNGEFEPNPFQNITRVYCSFGTTKKNAGSADNFIKIDKEYVISTAKLAKAAGVEEFHYVSASNANASSSLLYPRTKGEIEAELSKINFDRLFIYHPGLLICDRVESRPLERFGIFVGRFFTKMSDSLGIKTSDLAAAIVTTSLEKYEGKISRIVSNAECIQISKK